MCYIGGCFSGLTEDTNTNELGAPGPEGLELLDHIVIYIIIIIILRVERKYPSLIILITCVYFGLLYLLSRLFDRKQVLGYASQPPLFHCIGRRSRIKGSNYTTFRPISN